MTSADMSSGSRLAYHAFTYGVICGELIRRVAGRTPGQFFADEVAKPLTLELWIGLPAELESRVATLRRSADYAPTALGEGPEPLLSAETGALTELGSCTEISELPPAELD